MGSRAGPTVGLALAGGGPEGAVYELGALRAIEAAVDGLVLSGLSIYVGVSAGSFIAAMLANGVTTGQLCRAIVKTQPGEHPIDPRVFFKPAVGEWAQGALSLPGLFAEATVDYIKNPGDRTVVDALTHLTRALPVGVFDNEPLRRYLASALSIKDRTDDFRDLDRRLIVVAADLDSGEPVCFGTPGLDDVPISTAVQASTALPGVYSPVRIGERCYVDGVLLKTMHASVALEEGADLLFCVNPIVPVNTANAVASGAMRGGRLASRGLPTVLSQTFRTLIHSRLAAGFERYEPRFPSSDVILFEAGRDDYRMFFTNIFSFAARRTVCQHAYRATLEDIAARREELRAVLEPWGLHLRDDVIDEDDPDMWAELGVDAAESPSREPSRGAGLVATSDRAILDDLGAVLDRLEDLLEERR